MYLSNIKLWNFRKFGSAGEFDLEDPNLSLPLKHGLNVLIGENDSGKSAIIDAIKLVLGTHSLEWNRVDRDDFYGESNRFRIELIFDDFSDEEGKNFTEWIAWTGAGMEIKPFLKLIFDVRRNSERILPSDVKAGADSEGLRLDAGARDYLKVTYLKPLRDARAELIPKRNSRLSQIFQGHEAFKGKEKVHYLVQKFQEFNKTVEMYFEGKDANDAPLLTDAKGKDLKDEIDRYVRLFSASDRGTDISVTSGELRSILEKLELAIKDEINPGLGTLNQLFMASELVHLKKQSWNGLRLALVEELEAHIHPQSQMQIIEGLQQETGIQILLTTHSPNLASKVRLGELIICNNLWAFPMGKDTAGIEFTALNPDDHKFLEHFLDVTKSNLFFAKGVIMVEGWAEEILLPALAKKMKKIGLISKDLTDAGVSVVNVGGMSLLRYSKIFVRKEGVEMNVPVAIVTDVDVAAFDRIPSLDTVGNPIKNAKGKVEYEYVPRETSVVAGEIDVETKKKEIGFNAQRVRVFVSQKWTLEYCLFKSNSLSKPFTAALKSAHPKIDSNDLEREMAKKLINKGLDKTEIARRLALKLIRDSKRRVPKISLDKNDESIKYLFDAIIHACGN